MEALIYDVLSGRLPELEGQMLDGGRLLGLVLLLCLLLCLCALWCVHAARLTTKAQLHGARVQWCPAALPPCCNHPPPPKSNST